MKFSMTHENANLLYKFSKSYCEPSKSKHEFSFAACKIQDEFLVATMITRKGERGALVSIPVFDIESNADEVAFIMPPEKSFKKADCTVTVVDSALKTEYTTATRAEYYIKHDTGSGRLIDLNRLLKDEPKFSIWFSPKLLADSLSAFDGEDRVRIDFVGTRTALYLTNDDKNCKALVFPVMPPKGQA